MKKSLIFKSALAAIVLFASAALVSCEKEVETPNPDTDATKPVAVQFAYTNVESEDMLEYCNIIMEYTDANGTKVDTVTTTDWTKVLTAPLPCSLTFKKSYTLKEDKDMTSVEKIKITFKTCKYHYNLLDVNGEIIDGNGDSKGQGDMTPSSSNAAAMVSAGRLDAVHTFTFDENGKLVY